MKFSGLRNDFDIEITENEESELLEKEYSDILGLEGMVGGGEAALSEETEEEKEEPGFGMAAMVNAR